MSGRLYLVGIAAAAGLGLLALSPVDRVVAAGGPTGTRPLRPGDAAKLVPLHLDPWRFLAAPPPVGWSEPSFDDRAWKGPGQGPFAPRQRTLPGLLPVVDALGTHYEVTPGAPLLLRTRFAVADPARVRVLELAITYADGFVAYVNGREVARRGIAVSSGAPAAAAPHGPEEEHITVPVGSAELPTLAREGNSLAVAIYGYRGRSAMIPTAPAGAVELTASSGVRIVRGPYLAAPAEEGKTAGVDLIWETDLPATGTVVLEPVDRRAGGPRRMAVGRATRQVVRLGSLPRGASYSYRVEVEAAPGDRAVSVAARFSTASVSPAPMRFAVYGDMRYPGHDAHRSVVDALVREAPSVVFNTGDLTDEGSQESNWQRYFEITAPLGAIAPVIPALGNHDAGRGGAGSAIAWSLFRAPPSGPPGWTSMDLGGVHFVVLDTNAMRDGRQRAWLADDLARVQQKHPRAIFAFCHEGPWSHALHGGESLMVRDYAPLLVEGHVDLLFSGHDHIYERGVGNTRAGKLPYIVAGGGGAPLYNPTCAAVTGPPPGDVPGPLRPCPPWVVTLTKAYHYVVVEVTDKDISVCPRRPDGSPIEACIYLTPRHN